MDDVKIKKALTVLWKLAVIIIFAVLVIFVGQHHEHWSDEAQSFLIARDNSCFEIFKYAKYEGTPPVWFFIIKIFILLGGTYSTYYLLPILFSVIGVCILEFKVDVPWYIKVLLPFTYFIAYQYSIVVRSYCLLFPMLMLLVCLDKKKLEKPILYGIALFPLMIISLHSLCIAGSLFLIFIIDIVKNKKIKSKKHIIACVIIFFELLLTALLTYPSSDCYYQGNKGRNIAYIVAEATFSVNFKFYIIIFILVAIAFAIMLFENHNKSKILEFFILFTPVLGVLTIIHCVEWHIGIIYLVMIYYLCTSDLLNTNKLAKIFLTGMCIVQIIWTVASYKYDLNNNYSGCQVIANYIKDNNYENKKIYGLGYSVTAIQPYFEHNIFANQRPQDKACWSWSKKDSCIFDSEEEILDANADIYIISMHYVKKYEEIIEKLEEKNYEGKCIFAFTYFKTHELESEGYIIYQKKDI